MIITFIGHRTLGNQNDLHDKIQKVINENVPFQGETKFYCGGYGDFDNLCAQACRAIKKKQPCCEIVFITPYITKAQQEKMRRLTESCLYDSILYPPLEKIPYKFAISKRNEWMVDQADLIIAYVEHAFGGTYKSLVYAKRKKKAIINLAEQ